MAKIKNFFSTYKKRICALAGAISCAVSLILTIICYIVGGFLEGGTSVTIFDSISKAFGVIGAFSISTLIDALFGLTHIICLAILGLSTFLFVRRSIRVVRALLQKDDDRLADEMTFIRERSLNVWINLAMYVIFGTILSPLSLSAYAVVCLSFAVFGFAMSTTCLMFVAHDDIPLPSHIATECVRYVLAPIVVGITFIFAIPKGAVASIYFKIFNLVSSYDALLKSDQTLGYIKSIYFIVVESVLALVTIFLFIKLVTNLIDNITPNSRTYVADKHSAKKLFLILGIISGARVVLRFVMYTFFVDGGISADFMQMISAWFNSVRNDMLPLCLVCFTGFCLLFSSFERGEPKQEPTEDTSSFSLGNSFFTTLKPGQME